MYIITLHRITASKKKSALLTLNWITMSEEIGFNNINSDNSV